MCPPLVGNAVSLTPFTLNQIPFIDEGILKVKETLG